jgi:hypothetical protein
LIWFLGDEVDLGGTVGGEAEEWFEASVILDELS